MKILINSSKYVKANRYSPNWSDEELRSAFSSVNSLAKAIQKLSQDMNTAYDAGDLAKANQIRQYMIFLLDNKETLFNAYSKEI